MQEIQRVLRHKSFIHFTAMKQIARAIFTMITLSFCVFAVSSAVVNAQFTKPAGNPFTEASADGEVWSIDVVGTDGGTTKKDTFVNVVKGAINRVLGILALIALIILLWWGFQMVTANWDDGRYAAWFTLLKQAAWGLAMIGVAWFLVSIIFFVINLVTQEAGSGAGTES